MDTVHSSVTRERNAALRLECLRLRLLSARRQRQSVELRTACAEAGHACRATIEQSKARTQPRLTSARGGPMDLDLASVIANALAGVGIQAFILEPSRDSAPTS